MKSMNNLAKHAIKNLLLQSIAAITLIGCKTTTTAPDTQDDASEAVNQCTQERATDPLLSIEIWASSSPDAQDLSEDARQLRSSWGDASLEVVRAWKNEDGSWSALLSNSPEPDTNDKVILLVIQKDSKGIWSQAMPAQVTDADTLWPQL